jgi:hypothetical protein
MEHLPGRGGGIAATPGAFPEAMTMKVELKRGRGSRMQALVFGDDGQLFAAIVPRTESGADLCAGYPDAVCMLFLYRPGGVGILDRATLDRAGYALDNDHKGEFFGWIVDLACEEGLDLSGSIALAEGGD